MGTLNVIFDLLSNNRKENRHRAWKGCIKPSTYAKFGKKFYHLIYAQSYNIFFTLKVVFFIPRHITTTLSLHQCSRYIIPVVTQNSEIEYNWAHVLFCILRWKFWIYSTNPYSQVIVKKHWVLKLCVSIVRLSIPIQIKDLQVNLYKSWPYFVECDEFSVEWHEIINKNKQGNLRL